MCVCAYLGRGVAYIYVACLRNPGAISPSNIPVDPSGRRTLEKCYRDAGWVASFIN